MTLQIISNWGTWSLDWRTLQTKGTWHKCVFPCQPQNIQKHARRKCIPIEQWPRAIRVWAALFKVIATHLACARCHSHQLFKRQSTHAECDVKSHSWSSNHCNHPAVPKHTAMPGALSYSHLESQSADTCMSQPSHPSSLSSGSCAHGHVILMHLQNSRDWRPASIHDVVHNSAALQHSCLVKWKSLAILAVEKVTTCCMSIPAHCGAHHLQIPINTSCIHKTSEQSTICWVVGR